MSRIKLQNVRICFPSLFHTSSFGGEDTGKYDATLVLDKKEHGGIIKEIEAAIKELSKEKFKGKLPPVDKLCIKDGTTPNVRNLKGHSRSKHRLKNARWFLTGRNSL